MTQADRIKKAVGEFGATAKAKLSGEGQQPEDQLRNPIDELFKALGLECGLSAGSLVLKGEMSLAELRTRPDFAVEINKALVGFIEVKAPGKGADPRKWKAGHDKEQWDKLKALPNLLYTDGDSFSLWRDGALVGQIIHFEGGIEHAGAKLLAPQPFLPLINDFLSWAPIAPKGANELARVSARLCRFLRDEVIEQLGAKNAKLSELKDDWKALLFPDADDAKFADGYSSDWRQFEAWCDERGLEPLPARAEAVATYLAVLAQAGRADSTIGREWLKLGGYADIEKLNTHLRFLHRRRVMVWRLELVRSLDCGPSERFAVSELGEIAAPTDLDGVGFDLTTSQRIQCDLQRAVVAVQGRALKAKAALMRQVDPTLSLKDYRLRSVQTLFGTLVLRVPRLVRHGSQLPPPCLLRNSARSTTDYDQLRSRLGAIMSFGMAERLVGDPFSVRCRARPEHHPPPGIAHGDAP